LRHQQDSKEKTKNEKRKNRKAVERVLLVLQILNDTRNGSRVSVFHF
jgi:hypothetical protein